jgi:hypothetical protein
MDQTYKEGATVLMIDSQMFDNIVSYSGLFTQSHRIVYEGGLTFFNDNNESIRNVGNETELFFYLRHGDVVLTQTAKCYQNMTTYLFVALKVHSMISLSVETLWEKIITYTDSYYKI